MDHPDWKAEAEHNSRQGSKTAIKLKQSRLLRLALGAIERQIQQDITPPMSQTAARGPWSRAKTSILSPPPGVCCRRLQPCTTLAWAVLSGRGRFKPAVVIWLRRNKLLTDNLAGQGQGAISFSQISVHRESPAPPAAADRQRLIGSGGHGLATTQSGRPAPGVPGPAPGVPGW